VAVLQRGLELNNLPAPREGDRHREELARASTRDQA
jgi:hypothetical protein